MKKIFVIFGALLLLTIASTISVTNTESNIAYTDTDGDQFQTFANKIYPGA